MNNLWNKIFRFLTYITNNNHKPTHEKEFDIAFFLISTAALIIGIYVLIMKQTQEWIAFLVVEYIWCVDNLRHNRP